MEKMKAIGQQNTGLKRKIGEWAKGVALKGNINLEQGCVFIREGFAVVLRQLRSEVTVRVCVVTERFGNWVLSNKIEETKFRALVLH